MSDNFNNRKNSIDSSKESLGIPHYETYSDQVKTLHLLHSFHKLFSSLQTYGMKKLKATSNEHDHILLKGDSCENILQKNNCIFCSRIKTCYKSFTRIGDPIGTTS